MARIMDDDLDDLLLLTYSKNAKVHAEAARELCPCHVKRNQPVMWDRVLAMADDLDARLRRRYNASPRILTCLCDAARVKCWHFIASPGR